MTPTIHSVPYFIFSDALESFMEQYLIMHARYEKDLQDACFNFSAKTFRDMPVTLPPLVIHNPSYDATIPLVIRVLFIHSFFRT